MFVSASNSFLSHRFSQLTIRAASCISPLQRVPETMALDGPLHNATLTRNQITLADNAMLQDGASCEADDWIARVCWIWQLYQ